MQTRVLLVDNFDSFTHNLAQCLGGLGAEVVAQRPGPDVADLVALAPDLVVLSPGPGHPADAAPCAAAYEAFVGRVPVLGVCLGMQVIALVHGAEVGRAPEAVHGKASAVRHDGRGLFRGLPVPFAGGRYHSLAVVPGTLPSALEPTAWVDGVLMGFRRRDVPVHGLQFHPESVLTPDGGSLLANFLSLAAR